VNWFDSDLEKFNAHLVATARRRILDEPQGIDLCSNDYLCLASDPRLKAALHEGVDLYGAGSTASRLVRGHRSVFDALEKKISAWVGSEAALFFANGYAANVGCLSAICDPSYDAFVDRLAHASLVDGVRLSGARKIYFHHNDLGHLEEQLAKSRSRKKIIISESLFSMDGDFAPFEALAALAQKYEALSFIDDAHAIGVYGDEGRGLASSVVNFRMVTLGKALGLEGALVAMSIQARELMLHRARTFVFSTAPLPMIAHAALSAIDLVRAMNAERRQIHMFSETLRTKIQECGFSTLNSMSHIVPILCKDEAHALELAARMQKAGLAIKAIRPPTVKQSRLRISLNAGVTSEHIVRICQNL